MSSDPGRLLARLNALGATVTVSGNRIRVEAPGELPEDLLQALREQKADLLPLARLLGMPLDLFAREGSPIEVRVPWLPVTLGFVPTEADAEALAREGASRGRIWTARELMNLLAIDEITTEEVKTIASAKLEFGGEVVEVRPRSGRGGEAA